MHEALEAEMIAAGKAIEQECIEAGMEDDKRLWHVYLAMQAIVEFYAVQSDTRH